MKNIIRTLVVSLLCWTVTLTGFSRESVFGNFKSTESIKSTAAGCSAPSGFRFLTVNNVRARINTGGDMWWDLPGGIGSQYYVPANGAATSLFSGSLWIGGLDINNQLKLAALRYRQVGQDYWTGPLTIDGTASIDPETCTEYDRFWVITREEVDQYIQHTDPETGAYIPSPDYQIPESFFDYPAHGDVAMAQSFYLAPFKDADNDGFYDPTRGDYPYYDVTNELCPLNYAGDPDYVPAPTMESELYENFYGGILVDQVLKGDQTLWWVFNDKGNIHTETNGAAIGLEIRAQAFGFATNDEINSMTFYNYEIINRSTYELTQTYFSPWVDTDLGYAWDDYVGCDVGRGLGYCYNGTPVDEGGPEAYGEQPPAIGVDFFQGPYMDPDTCDNPSFIGDGLLGPTYRGSCQIVSEDDAEIFFNFGQDNDTSGLFNVQAEAINGINFGNGIIDDERYGMRRFVYHNNQGPAYSTDPQEAPEYYNFLQGIWKDNSKMLYGGNAHSSAGAAGPDCDFMFPGDSDPCNWGTRGIPPNDGFNSNGLYWTEEVVGNAPGDRRFMQSAGPFTLKSGAVNYITVGIPWARAISGGPWASVSLLRVVDDKCQALFENCFKVIDGPDAPDLTIREYDKELLIYITNSVASNNYNESYEELDPLIKALTPDSLLGTPEEYDAYYHFEGYKIYQLADAEVTLAESLYDLDKVRLVAQYDVQNGVGKIVNYKYDRAIGGNVPVVEVDGADDGISHTFKITEDAFATGDRTLVNNKYYYYSAVAYGYNNYKLYDPTDPTALDGQKEPYLEGRKNIDLYIGIPHIPVNGIMANSTYGDGPQIQRIEGQGNGGMVLNISDETVEEILSKPPAYLVFDKMVENPAGGMDSVFVYNYGYPDYPISYNPVYLDGAGPVNIQVVDPLSVRNSDYTLWFDSAWIWKTFYNVTGTEGLIAGGDTAGVRGVAKWYLKDNNSGEIFVSDVPTTQNFETVFPDIGLSVTFGSLYYSGLYKIGEQAVSPTPSTPADTISIYQVIAYNNDLLTSSIIYEDSSRRWLSGVPDVDGLNSFNWIRSGTSFNGDGQDDWASQTLTFDPESAFEQINNGTFAPYFMCARKDQDANAPAFNANSKNKSGGLRAVASVDVVLTPDKSKWSRCPVIEMCNSPQLSENGALRFMLRKSASLDKDGNPSGWPSQTEASQNPNDANYILAYGMSWFPGYAINLETGERMNMMFGEDSWLSGQNGRDMIFNPSPNLFSTPSGEILFGGKHYMYVMASAEIDDVFPTGDRVHYTFPAYDAGKSHAVALSDIPEDNNSLNLYGTYIYSSAMYVGMPLSVATQEWLSNDVTIKVRMAKPYERFYAGPLESDTSQNDQFPMYKFSTANIATTYLDPEKASTDLDLIRVVPNPYYAWAVGSGYEEVPLQNLVKITNLPEKCTVSIYNVSGTLIRQLTKDSPITFLNWDLKNHAGIPIAGGVYILHVKDNTSNEERIVKWFGSLRIEDFKEF